MSTESDFYRANVPDRLNEQVVRLATLAVMVAQAESRQFPGLELNAVPPLRRLNYQCGILDSAFPPGVEVVEFNHPGLKHVGLRAGGVTITSLTRAKMPQSIKPQPYQRTLARSALLKLPFPNLPPDPLPHKLLGLVIFGGHYQSRTLKLCRVAFPTPDGDFAPGTIDLLSEYASVVREYDDTEYAKEAIAQFIAARESIRA